MNPHKSPFQTIGNSRYQRGTILHIIPLPYGVEVILSTGNSLHLHQCNLRPFNPEHLANQISLGSDITKVYVTSHPCPDLRPNFFPPRKAKHIHPPEPRRRREPFKPSEVTEPLRGHSSWYPDSYRNGGSSGSSGNGRGGR